MGDKSFEAVQEPPIIRLGLGATLLCRLNTVAGIRQGNSDGVVGLPAACGRDCFLLRLLLDEGWQCGSSQAPAWDGWREFGILDPASRWKRMLGCLDEMARLANWNKDSSASSLSESLICSSGRHVKDTQCAESGLIRLTQRREWSLKSHASTNGSHC